MQYPADAKATYMSCSFYKSNNNKYRIGITEGTSKHNTSKTNFLIAVSLVSFGNIGPILVFNSNIFHFVKSSNMAYNMQFLENSLSVIQNYDTYNCKIVYCRVRLTGEELKLS